MPLREDFANATANLNTHPQAHNETNDVVNTHGDQIASIFATLVQIANDLGPDISGVFNNATERIGVMELVRALNGVGFVVHGSNAATARPTAGFGIYIWLGTVQPNNWANNDIYIDLAP